MITLQRCTANDLEQLMAFIHSSWKKDHIFTHNKKIFDFQHQSIDNLYNFILAKDDQNGQIVGIFGYIPTSHYDSSLSEKSNYVWGAIWIVKEDINAPGLGLLMLKKVVKQYTGYGAIGLSLDAVNMYKILGYTTSTVNQYYILNPYIDEFRIAKIPHINHPKPIEYNCNVVPIILNETIAIEGYYTPIKSITYFINRYLNHPIYQYEFLGCYANGFLKLILVLRTIEVNRSKCKRIIDVLGDLSSVVGLGFVLQNYLSSFRDTEYIDLMNWGINPKVFTENGFMSLDTEQDDIIIPNYFEPFEPRNVKLICGHNSKDHNYVFFKGDADQDRPNII